ncbi:replication protein, partial [uncultured marine virus]
FQGGVILEPPLNLAKKQISPAKSWCFTLNNWTEEEYSSIVLLLEEHCCLYVCGKEIGEECGTPHLQGYLVFKTKKRPKSVFAFTDRIRWKKAGGNATQNLEYCNKGKDFITKGYPKPIKLIDPVYEWEQEILEIIKEEPDDRTIYWYWSEK